MAKNYSAHVVSPITIMLYGNVGTYTDLRVGHD